MSYLWVSNTYLGTTYEVGTTVSVVDGRVAPYDTLLPGDTIALLAGTHHPITFKNIQGSAIHPITIINSGGLVEFTDTAHEQSLLFKNCEHFRLTGSGDGGITYGIQFTRYYSKAILGTCKTRNCELDHLKIMESTDTATGIGIHVSNYGLPAAYVNSYNWDAFDYDGDGSLDADDLLDGRYWTADGIKIHDCYFNGTEGVYNLDVSMYLGYSNYTETPHTRDLYDSGGVLHTGVTVYFPPSDNVEVYNCLFEHTNMKCVQVGSCLTSCLVHDNVFNDVCYQVAEHDPVIGINPASSGVKIYNNRMINLNNGMGVYSYGEQVAIYNNVIVDPGYYGIVVGALRPTGYHHYESTWVMNNTIVTTYAAHGVVWANSEGTDDRLQNNIIINTNALYYSATLDVVGNNYFNTNVDNAKFTNHDLDDYTLASDSPCRNAGADLTAYGVTDDIVGTSRPQGAAYDEGAYEYSA